MTTIEQIAEAALAGEALQTRSLAQDFLLETTALRDVPRPSTDDPTVLAIAAAILELMAARLGQESAPWTETIGPAPEPIFLLRAARDMWRLRSLCERESPEPLRRRGLFAPANYLATA